MRKASYEREEQNNHHYCIDHGFIDICFLRRIPDHNPHNSFIGLDARLAYCSMHQCGTAFEREIKPLAAATLNLLSVEEVGIMGITRDISERKRAEEA
jgi:hypothetical protein